MPHTLLLADDSVTIQRVIELTFADEDIRVIAVSDGAQAVREVQSERPDIVLADVGMPEMDGYEVAAFIKRTPGLQHIPVLLLTGAFEPIDEARARAVGCDGVLVKPFEPQMVISRVKDLIAGRPISTTPPRGDTPLGVPPAAVSAPAPATDEYFDRLDAALASFDAAAATQILPAAQEPQAPPSAASGPAAVSAPAPAVSTPALMASAPTPAASAPEARVPASTPSASAPPPSASVLAEAFEALLAAEQGRPLASVAAQKLASSDSLIDHITKQVIERLADDRMRDAVLEVAERLVREEIARIKSAAQPG